MAEYNPSKIIKDGNTYNFRDDTKIPLAGSNQISGSLIPSTDGTVNLGSPSYQWNNAYAKNYYYNGVAWGLDKANVWNTYQTIEGYYFGNEQSTNGRTCLYLTSNRDIVGQSGIYITKFRQNRAQGAMNPADLQFISFDVLENSIRTNSVLQLNITNWNEDMDVPSGAVLFSNLSNAQLGSPLAPWKTLNGINPGALSLPSNSYVNVDTTDFDVTSTTIGTFTPTVDGWAILNISQKNKPFGIWIIGGTYRVSFYSVKNNDDYFIFALIPVRANVTMTVYCTADDIDSTRKIGWLRLSPCQGNV